MGCASSKQKKKCCRHCGKAPYSPVRRSYSLHVHHPPQHSGDSYHVVALTSSTLGSLKVEIPNNSTLTIKEEDDGGEEMELGYDYGAIENIDSNPRGADLRVGGVKLKEINREQFKDFSKELMEARNWSNIIGAKIPKTAPKTPIRTPPGEPETINAWELMEGLEDTSPYLSPKHFRSFSFDVACGASLDSPARLNLKCHQENGIRSPKPEWLQSTDDETDSKTSTVITDFDPEIIASFRKSLEDLPPENPFHLDPLGSTLEVEKTVQDSPMNTSVAKNVDEDENEFINYPTKKDKAVLYFTSLRGVRKTYEDCCNVKMILKSIGVRIDERDVSMDSGFKEELKQLLGDGFLQGGLPRVFVGRKYIGSAEEIQRLHEEGKLEKRLEGCAKVDDIDSGGVCEACGDVRFVPCETCSGSCKIYYEEEDDYNAEEEEGGDVESGFQRCPHCNENGLIRCPICCD